MRNLAKRSRIFKWSKGISFKHYKSRKKSFKRMQQHLWKMENIRTYMKAEAKSLKNLDYKKYK